MSGGTWDLKEHQLRWLAEALREGRGRCHEDGDPPLEMERARTGLACVLDTLADLIHNLDCHFTGDSYVPSRRGSWAPAPGSGLTWTATSGGRNDVPGRPPTGGPDDQEVP